LELRTNVEARIEEAEERLILIRGDLLYVDDATSEAVRFEIAGIQSVLVKLRKILAEFEVGEEQHPGEFKTKIRALLDQLEDHFEAIDSLLGHVSRRVPGSYWVAAQP
jgi:hypothetical protein